MNVTKSGLALWENGGWKVSNIIQIGRKYGDMMSVVELYMENGLTGVDISLELRLAWPWGWDYKPSW